MDITPEMEGNALATLEYINPYIPYIKDMGGTKNNFLMALMFLNSLTVVDSERLFQKVIHNIRTLNGYSGTVDWLEAIEPIYNYHLNAENKVYMKTEYLKAQDKKYAWYRTRYAIGKYGIDVRTDTNKSKMSPH